MGSKIERGSEIALRTGRVVIKGTYAPLVYFLGLEQDARGLRGKTMGTIPFLIPTVSGLIIGGVTHDFPLAVSIGAGGLYAEGVLLSSIAELYPSDQRSLRKKVRSFVRDLGFRYPKRLRLPK